MVEWTLELGSNPDLTIGSERTEGGRDPNRTPLRLRPHSGGSERSDGAEGITENLRQG